MSLLLSLLGNVEHAWNYLAPMGFTPWRQASRNWQRTVLTLVPVGFLLLARCASCRGLPGTGSAGMQVGAHATVLLWLWHVGHDRGALVHRRGHKSGACANTAVKMNNNKRLSIRAARKNN